jgi:hypothetical protein
MALQKTSCGAASLLSALARVHHRARRELAESSRRVSGRQRPPQCSLRRGLRSRPPFRSAELQRGFVQIYCAQALTHAGLSGMTIAAPTTVSHDAFHADAEKGK